MAFVGFDFNKINVEKKEKPSGKININSNVNIVGIEKADLGIAKDAKSAVKFKFEYISDYTNLGKIALNGSVMYLTTADEVKTLLKMWEDKEKLPQELMTQLLNKILMKCNVKTILLSDMVNMPPPVPLPKVQVKK